MANLSISGSCAVIKNGVTSTVNASFTADVRMLIEFSRDIDNTWTSIIDAGIPFAFVLIVNNGNVDAYWSVIPSGGVATERVFGSVPPGGHALLPSVITTDATGSPQELKVATSSGTTSIYVMYGTTNV